MAHDGDAYFAQLFVVKNMTSLIKRVNRFVDSDVTEGNGSAAVFKNLCDLVVSVQTYTTRAFHIKNRRYAGFRIFETGNTSH